MIVLQNNAALEFSKETLKLNSDIQNLLPIDSKVIAIKKVEGTIESNECILFPSDSTNKLSTVVVIVAQNESKAEPSDKTLEPDLTFTESVTIASIRILGSV